MAVLRKRKAAPPAPEKITKKRDSTAAANAKLTGRKGKRSVAIPTALDNAGEELATAPLDETAPSKERGAGAGAPRKGDVVDLDGFGGDVQTTSDGEMVTLKKLIDDSEAGVVLFTYPKASTPGCTTQACLFRDSFSIIASSGFSVYGLSADSPKSNATFKTKHSLPYTLLCNPSFSLIKSIGMQKTPKGTKRGVVAIGKNGEVLVAETGTPSATLELVKELVESLKT